MGEYSAVTTGNGTGNSITLPAAVENIGKITAFVEGKLEELDCPLKKTMEISVAACGPIPLTAVSISGRASRTPFSEPKVSSSSWASGLVSDRALA